MNVFGMWFFFFFFGVRFPPISVLYFTILFYSFYFLSTRGLIQLGAMSTLVGKHILYYYVLNHVYAYKYRVHIILYIYK